MKEVEGTYKVELLGLYGWETFSTAFIHNGEFRSASDKHFTVGSYAVQDGGFSMVANMTQHENHQTLFGRNNINGLPIKFNAKIYDGVIEGEARVTGDSSHSLRFRLNRLTFLNQDNAAMSN